MSWPVPTINDLSTFSGRPVASFSNVSYANESLIQAVLFFQIVTELIQPPDPIADPLENQLATNGILDFALTTYLEQPYQGIKANPFQSQTIGSTSYSKPVLYMRGTAQANALRGEATGIMWFDLAVQQLAQRTQRGGVFGDAIAFFDKDFSDGISHHRMWLSEEWDEWGNCQRKILGPGDVDTLTQTFFDWNMQGGDFGGGMNSTSGMAG